MWSYVGRMLSRETSGGAFIPHVDGLRFMAIGSVVLYHAAGYLREKRPGGGAETSVLHGFAEHGWFGVQLFFAISGFILALPFAAARMRRSGVLGGGTTGGSSGGGGGGSGEGMPSLRRYFLRRVTRLEPPYLINLAVCAALVVVLAGRGWGEVWPHLLASVFYVHNIAYGELSGMVNPVTWSLEIEVQFYILAPWLALVYSSGSAAVRRGLIVAGVAGFSALQYALPGDHAHRLTLAHHAHYFLVGFLLAELHLTRWSGGASRRWWAWDAAGLVAWVLMWWVIEWDRGMTGVFHAASPWLVFVAYGGAWRGRAWRWVFTRRWVYLVGGMCYTLYLWHPLVVSGVGRVVTGRVLPALGEGSFDRDLVVLTVVVVVGLLVAGSALFVLTEKPFMRRDWFGRLAARLGISGRGG
ncbi:MAG: acyltransferase [Phycisphaeraceae bacterium]|nr:MAG: acyltransferase [Phycisphaeraceae bacterium]